MPFSDAAMTDAANAIRNKYKYAQLHTAAAGVDGTSHKAASIRVAFSWAEATAGGNFDIQDLIYFTNGTPNGTLYSVTIWDQATLGTFGGEFVLAGDHNYNSAGAYTVTSLVQTGQTT